MKGDQLTRLNTMLLTMILCLTTVLIFSVFLYMPRKALAQPSGANITEIQSSRRQNPAPQTLEVQAGNVTEVNIYAVSITNSWSGVYGNVTGVLILADSNNNTFYDWTVASPQGEVYASRTSSIDWANVRCANATEIADENANLNMGSYADNITNTFNKQNHPSFYVGSVGIAANTCKSTNAYNASGSQDTLFYNILLSDGSGNIIYTSILEQDAEGFDSRTHDFELLLGEDGHGAAAGTTTTYYFWVEIE